MFLSSSANSTTIFSFRKLPNFRSNMLRQTLRSIPSSISSNSTTVFQSHSSSIPTSIPTYSLISRQHFHKSPQSFHPIKFQLSTISTGKKSAPRTLPPPEKLAGTKITTPGDSELTFQPEPYERYFIVGELDCPMLRKCQEEYLQIGAKNAKFHPQFSVHFSLYTPLQYDTRRIEILQSLSLPPHTISSSIPIAFSCQTKVVPPPLVTNGLDRAIFPTTFIGDSTAFLKHIQLRYHYLDRKAANLRNKGLGDGSALETEANSLSEHVFSKSSGKNVKPLQTDDFTFTAQDIVDMMKPLPSPAMSKLTRQISTKWTDLVKNDPQHRLSTIPSRLNYKQFY